MFLLYLLIILGSFIGESTTCAEDFSTLLRFLTMILKSPVYPNNNQNKLKLVLLNYSGLI